MDFVGLDPNDDLMSLIRGMDMSTEVSHDPCEPDALDRLFPVDRTVCLSPVPPSYEPLEVATSHPFSPTTSSEASLMSREAYQNLRQTRNGERHLQVHKLAFEDSCALLDSGERNRQINAWKAQFYNRLKEQIVQVVEHPSRKWRNIKIYVVPDEEESNIQIQCSGSFQSFRNGEDEGIVMSQVDQLVEPLNANAHTMARKLQRALHEVQACLSEIKLPNHALQQKIQRGQRGERNQRGQSSLTKKRKQPPDDDFSDDQASPGSSSGGSDDSFRQRTVRSRLPSRRKAQVKVKKKVSPEAFPDELQLPLLIYFRLRRSLKSCPKGVLYAFLLQFTPRGEQRGGTRAFGHLWVPRNQETIEEEWGKMNASQRIKYLQLNNKHGETKNGEESCPWKFRKFPEACRFMVHLTGSPFGEGKPVNEKGAVNANARYWLISPANFRPTDTEVDIIDVETYANAPGKKFRPMTHFKSDDYVYCRVSSTKLIWPLSVPRS